MVWGLPRQSLLFLCICLQIVPQCLVFFEYQWTYMYMRISKNMYMYAYKSSLLIFWWRTLHYFPLCCCSVDYNLDQAESDTLLLELLEIHDDMEVDMENQKSRSENRYPSLFGLYPLPNREEAKENRLPAPPPAEYQGLKLHVKVSELRWVLCIFCGVVIHT